MSLKHADIDLVRFQRRRGMTVKTLAAIFGVTQAELKAALAVDEGPRGAAEKTRQHEPVSSASSAAPRADSGAAPEPECELPSGAPELPRDLARLYALLAAGPADGMARRDIIDKLAVSESTSFARLHRLRGLGLVELTGDRRTARWRIKPTFAKATAGGPAEAPPGANAGEGMPAVEAALADGKVTVLPPGQAWGGSGFDKGCTALPHPTRRRGPA